MCKLLFGFLLVTHLWTIGYTDTLFFAEPSEKLHFGESFSLEVDVTLEESSNDRETLADFGECLPGGSGVFLRRQDSTLCFGITVTGPSLLSPLYSHSPLERICEECSVCVPTGTGAVRIPTRVVGVLEGSQVRLFVNQVTRQTNCSRGLNEWGAVPLVVGGKRDGSEPLRGKIHLVRLWEVPRGAEYIKLVTENPMWFPSDPIGLRVWLERLGNEFQTHQGPDLRRRDSSSLSIGTFLRNPQSWQRCCLVGSDKFFVSTFSEVFGSSFNHRTVFSFF